MIDLIGTLRNLVALVGIPTGASLSVDIGVVDTVVDGLAVGQGRVLCCMDFWSPTQTVVTIPAGAADQALPTVTLGDLPAGATIVRAIAMFKFRMVENSNVAANKLTGAQEIQVNDSGGAGWVDAIQMVDDLFSIAASTREGGDVLIGQLDISARVDGDDTYPFQWDEAVADVASLLFNDVQTGLRIWYSI